MVRRKRHRLSEALDSRCPTDPAAAISFRLDPHKPLAEVLTECVCDHLGRAWIRAPAMEYPLPFRRSLGNNGEMRMLGDIGLDPRCQFLGDCLRPVWPYEPHEVTPSGQVRARFQPQKGVLEAEDLPLHRSMMIRTVRSQGLHAFLTSTRSSSRNSGTCSRSRCGP